MDVGYTMAESNSLGNVLTRCSAAGVNAPERLYTSGTDETLRAVSELISQQSYEAAKICSSGYVSQEIVRPAVEAGMTAYLNACSACGDLLISGTWSLCSSPDTYNCDGIYRYTDGCRMSSDTCNCRDNNNPQPATPGDKAFMEGVMEDPSAIALLVSLVLIGLLIGIASTVAVCLICPSVYRWANSKIRTEKETCKCVQRQVSYRSSSYADIDEKQFQPYVALRTVSSSTRSSHSVISPQSSNEPRPPLAIRRSRDSTDKDIYDYDFYPGAGTSHRDIQDIRAPVTNYEVLDGTAWKYREYIH